VTVVIRGASMTLAHVPSLVPYGSKPARDIASDPSGEHAARLVAAARPHPAAVSYAPNRVFVGALAPEELWDLERPYWGISPNGAGPLGRYGEVLDEASFYGLLRAVDQFDLVRLEPAFAERARSALAAHPLLAPHAEAVQGGDVEAALAGGALPLRHGGEIVGAARADHGLDDSLKADVLLENLASKATGVLALRRLLADLEVEPESVDYALGCGEEAIGDRYQRGGGGLAKAVLEATGCTSATASDVKAFCCAPVHAIVLAATLIEAGVYDRVAVVAGGAMAKLGMKSAPALAKGVPVLEDVLAGFAVLLERGGDTARPGARIRLDCTGKLAVGAGASQQKLYESLCVEPLARAGLKLTDVDRYAVELHDPEVTEPAGGGDVPGRNYRMLGGLAVMRGELERDALSGFARERGLPGFAPTQGHIASAMPWLPHALDRLASGQIDRTMLVAKGSLFLGRMTQMWDGMSVLIDREES
jgi:betaine reductase